jgi:hypothetical protein
MVVLVLVVGLWAVANVAVLLVLAVVLLRLAGR